MKKPLPPFMKNAMKMDPDKDGDAGKSESAKNEKRELTLKDAETAAEESGESRKVEAAEDGTLTPAQRLMHRDMQRMAARKSGPKVI